MIQYCFEFDPGNRNAGCEYYPLPIIFKKNNTCSCGLLKINYCDAGSIYLFLDTDKMYLLLCSCH